MAFIDPSSISNPEEQNWVVEISEILNDELKIKVETPSVSLFQVPETITTKKPEAYKPQQIGLGPIHHFRPGPYRKMEQKKLGIVRKVLHDYKNEDGQLVVLNNVRKVVPVVRSCYDMFLQGNDHESLAMIFAIDGLFLLNLFRTYNSVVEKEKEEYLVFLKDRAFKLKLSIQPSTIYESIPENNIEENMELDDFSYDILPPLLRQKEIAVTAENRTERERMLGLPHHRVKLRKVGPKKRLLAQDILMVENQNPFMVLKEIDEALHSSLPNNSSQSSSNFSYDILPPLLRQKEIVVTAENRTEWELILSLSHHRVELPKVGPKKRLLAQDILMVENQIPFMVLKEIDEALLSSLPNNSSQSSSNFSPSIFRTFCKVHSPLKLCSKSQAPTSVEHLLHYMYYSILNNAPIKIDEEPSDESHKKKKEDVYKYKPEYNRSMSTPIKQVYNLFVKIPQKEIVQAYEQTVSILETFSQSKILIPSASKLHDKVGFKFHSLLKCQGIQNIGILQKKIYLPCVTLNNDSEVVLRNLVAYETLTSKSDNFPLTEYMGLMCALILNVEDVKLLRSGDVITGDLSDNEVTKLFVGMSSSIPTMKTKGKSKLLEMIDEVNKVYESGMTMKIYLLLKKLARWLLVVLRAIGGFAEASWKIVAFMASIVTVFMLTSQAYCDVYGCDKARVTLLSYASS